MNQIQQKQLQGLLRNCYNAAQSYVDIISEHAIDQMKSEGIKMTIDNMNLRLMANMAAKNLGTDPQDIYRPYSELMVLLGYAEYEEMKGA